jgi:hypothetical protein
MKEKLHCETCRYWSETVAQSIGCGPLEAMCENKKSTEYGRMTVGVHGCAFHEPPRDPMEGYLEYLEAGGL